VIPTPNRYIPLKKFLAPLGIAVALLAVPLTNAHATGERSWTVCGGTPYAGYSGFALCASVTATVETNALGQHILTMKVYNLSGINGSYSGTVFTSIGLDNVIPSSVNVVAGSLKITGPCLESSSGCDYSSYWQLTDNKSIGGGVKVDLMGGAFNSQQSIASQCGVAAGTTPDHDRLFVTDCFPNGPNFVTLTFRVTEDFNPSLTGDLFIKGQNGYPDGEGSTTCISTNNNCGPTTVVPEPITATLFATGMGIWGGVGYIRRRRKGVSAEV
jgi:hypothetical protein